MKHDTPERCLKLNQCTWAAQCAAVYDARRTDYPLTECAPHRACEVAGKRDLSNQAGLGSIKGMPIVASRDERDPANLKVAVVVIQADNRIVSMDLYNSAWHRRWVYQSGTTPAVAYGLMAVATYGGQYFKPQIMLQTANNVFTVFTRTSWSSSYSYMYEVNFSGPGTPAFGRPVPECVKTGCAVFSNDNYSYPPGGISGHATCTGLCLATYIAPIASKDNAPWYSFSFSSVHTSLRDASFNPQHGNYPNTGLWYYPLATGHTPPVGPYPEFAHTSFFGYHNNTSGADSLMYLNELDVSDALYPSPGVLIGL